MQHNKATRRKFLGASGAVGSLLFAGCISSGSSDSNQEPTENSTPTSSQETTTDDTYTVSIEPVGDVEFDGPPEQWTALLPTFADMGFALGGGQTLGIQNHHRYANEAFDALPGLEHDQDEIVELVSGNVDKELFYEMNAEAHFIDPHILRLWYDWDQSDIDEVRSNIGPLFGSFIRRHSDKWHDYRYYDLYEAFALMADVFQAQDRYEAFVDLHDQMLDTIDKRLPPADQRPTALLVYPAGKNGTSFYPFRINNGGVSTKQWRDLGLSDALAETDVGHYSYSDDGTLGPEALVEIDPEALLVRNYGGTPESEFQKNVVKPLKENSVTSRITAVENDEIYNAGYLDQGPIINFYHTDQAAKDIYPDAFEGATLFDRERIAEIVSGNV
ncbi:ABC transporter substrate-binding protein [Salarchaeum sp. III]|uniref:ABC transporter substrate-binding protein n=1 Tax=Salarchaeum sp. III TaxID=3107927 RepID=UPI002EDA8B05